MAREELNCTFCEKPQSESKVLIASPDRLTYICGQYTLEAIRLNQSTKPFRCSFCWKKVDSTNLYVSSNESRNEPCICRDCLDVCRQILKQEGKAGLFSTTDKNGERIILSA
jgi:hypothetical protein